MKLNVESPFIVAGVLIAPEQNKLTLKDSEATVQPKVMAVLCYLANHHDQVVSKEELLEKVWEGQVVSYASVQKSINSLRKAFAALIGDTDVIKNYSKKGYQLLFAPEVQTSQKLTNTPQDELSDAPASRHAFSTTLLKVSATSLSVCICIAAIYFWFAQNDISQTKRTHKTEFSVINGFTSETGHERAALPNPDGRHIIYIRDIFNPSKLSLTQSQLWLRNEDGTEWLVNSSDASWFKLAWSPDQRRLLAVEVLRNKGQALTPDFYQAADYLYNIYIFDLDLEQHSVISKKLLTQWQGRLLSADWWNNENLEFVARQGANAVNQRYRYSIAAQEITPLKTSGFLSDTQPVASAILNGKTIIAAKRNQKIDIYFLDEQQKLLSHHSTEFENVSISWIPDQSGALIFSDGEHLSTLYLNGETAEIPYQRMKDKFIFWPRYSTNGQSIFVTEKTYRSNIVEFPISGGETLLTKNETYNKQPIYSHDGKKIVYISIRNNQFQLWLITDQQKEVKLQTPTLENIEATIWSNDDQNVLYKTEKSIHIYSLADNTDTLLLDTTESLTPLSYDAEEKLLIALRSHETGTNIWQINLENNLQSQRTFGSIGSVHTVNGNIYFQYVNKKGLWFLGHEAKKPSLISDSLPPNSFILSFSENKLYYLSGGACRESDIYVIDLLTRKRETYLKRENKVIATSSFHPEKGSVGRHCYLAESNIISLE